MKNRALWFGNGHVFPIFGLEMDEKSGVLVWKWSRFSRILVWKWMKNRVFLVWKWLLICIFVLDNKQITYV